MMSESKSERRRTFSIKTVWPTIVALAIVSLVVMAPGSHAGAEDSKTDAGAMNLIRSGGRELEGARLRSNDDLRAVSEEMLERLETMKTGGIRDDLLAGLFMLRGEALFIMEEYFGAEKSFRRAEKLYRKGYFPDDALYLRIRSMESSGDDAQAISLWKKWSGSYGDGPLDAKAQMGAIWNMIRREEFGAAEASLVSLKNKYLWMSGDPGLMLAEASVRYYREDFAGALSILERTTAEGVETEGTIFLGAVCREKTGDEFGAVREYHRFVRAFPSSVLAGYASLAKANIMSSREDYLSAASGFHRLALRSGRDDIRKEALLLEAMSEFLGGRIEHGMALMRNVAGYDHSATAAGGTDASEGSGVRDDIEARARFALGEMNWYLGRYADAVIDFNLVLSEHFDHELAGSALYRSARCVDALGRHAEANSTYQAVASGYPYASEAPAAVYLAGVGLLEQGLPLAAAPYFQLILDRYWGEDADGTYVFKNSEHQELAEAALCLLEYSYHQTGDMGQLSGAPHLVLHRMPPSNSRWRAWALLLDADALAEQARYPEAQETLAKLFREFPDDNVGIKANRLLAWTYSRQGREDLAIKTEERLLARYRAQDDWENMSAASLTLAHAWFNRKDYVEAGRRYSEFMNNYSDHPRYRTALYQYGLCAVRNGKPGDAVDAWERITDLDPSDDLAMKAWQRAGDLYFHTGHFDDARKCYSSIAGQSGDPDAAARGLLSLAMCDYNEGFDEKALDGFRKVIASHESSPAAEEAMEMAARAVYRLGIDNNDSGRLAQLVDEFPASPLASDAQLEIGLRHYEEKNYAGAAVEFKRMVNLFPTSSSAGRAWFLMADSWTLIDSVETARVAWTQFLDYFPESGLRPSAVFRLGMIRFNEGDYTTAAADFAEVLKCGVDDETEYAAAYNLGMSYRILGKKEEAVVVLSRQRNGGVDDDAKIFELTRLLGEIHEEEEAFDGAAEEYARALGVDGVDPGVAVELHYRKGFCLEKMGDVSGAMASYRDAMAFGGKTDTYRLSAVARYASLNEEKGDFKGALLAYKDLIKNTDDPELAIAARERADEIENAMR